MNYEQALRIATKAHEGQLRKISKKEYITHPIAVASKFNDEKHKVVAVLHDTIEDTELTLDDLRKTGLEEELITVVDVLTKKDNQSYLEYILLQKTNKIACAVKKEDLRYNLSDNPSNKCIEDKYLMALFILGSD